MHPHVGKARHVELAEAVLGHVNLVSNVVPHGDGEAVAEHRGGPEALEQLQCQVVLILLLLDGVLEQADELDAGAVHRVALLNGDALGLVPRKLPEGADHALEGALRAITRERRLREDTMSRLVRERVYDGCFTYSLRDFNVLHEHRL